ncbi:MAG: saccharopine dehydrogenase NADP-binding domain-containing protein [Desulfobacteraceae bacterium]|nr:saccharopine dehydrogenase NADP-binding domain-containing protein [Desulfobacteraceae bacterium]
MTKKQVLVVGGYGSIGSTISLLLSENNALFPIVAGRNEEKAKALATKLDCDFRTIDINDKLSIKKALVNIDIVICCYIDPDNLNTFLPEKVIELGLNYIDLSGRNEYNEKIIALNRKAFENNAILITALGLYPGIVGLLLADNKNYFEKIGSTEIYFAMGGNWDGISALSLHDIGYMMDIPPRQYNGKKWVETNGKGKNEYIGEPFNKNIFFYPCMITSDLLRIPETINSNKIAMWSGSESFLQGMVLYFGIKRGYAKIVEKAGKFLKVLRFIGRNKNKHCLMKIITKGSCDNIKHERIIEFNAKEELLTAIASVIVCEQIATGDMKKSGAYTAPQIVNTQTFFDSFKTKNVNYKESIKKFKILPKLNN